MLGNDINIESQHTLRGRAFILGDDVNTDLNCSGKYLPGKDEAYITAQAFEAVSPGFAGRFAEGGVIVAGKHFGINSSREQAIQILRRLGVTAIVAPSFGRQFFRNAINNGLPVLECDVSLIADGDELVLDFESNCLTVANKPIRRVLPVMPPVIRAILHEGGLIPFLAKNPQWELTA
jgi:3-isopropylmalate dehydratase small subunit